jgi:hypothetical protein
MSKKFEYLTKSFEIGLGIDTSGSLNKLGAEGWELISFTVSPSGNYYNGIFKREMA